MNMWHIPRAIVGLNRPKYQACPEYILSLPKGGVEGSIFVRH